MEQWSDGLYRPEDQNGIRLTLEEWLDLPEDEPGEFVDGVLREEEVPDAIHELAVAWLGALFHNWLGPGNGFVFGSELKMVLSGRSGRKPDLTVLFGRWQGPKNALRAPPDIAVEIVTPRPRDERRDRIEKMAEYAAFGVRFYWLLDPALGSLEVFELNDNGRYTLALSATEGVLNEIPGCHGLTMNLDALWAELRRLDET